MIMFRLRYLPVFLILLTSNCFADITKNTPNGAPHLRSSFSEAEACSDFTVVEKNRSGQIVGKSIAEAAVISDEVYKKEQDPQLATVNLIINEEPTRSLFSQLQQLAKINRTKYARVGSVYVVTKKNPISFAMQYSGEKLKDTFLSLSYQNTSFALKPVISPPAKYNVSHSPTWVIEHQGKEHVFEGNYSLSSLINNNGEFIGSDLEKR